MNMISAGHKKYGHMFVLLTQGEAERQHNPHQAHAREVIGHLDVQSVSLALQKNKALF
jgi:hypothetical protein